jgi:hypothetical protein
MVAAIGVLVRPAPSRLPGRVLTIRHVAICAERLVVPPRFCALHPGVLPSGDDRVRIER